MFANEYIEKIVQKSIPLPAIEQRDVDKFLDFHLDKLFKEINISQEERMKFEKDFPYIYQSQIKKLFKTLRHVKRYLNGLRSTLSPIKDEVNLFDFLILETIRGFYPKVYSDIWRNPWFYVPLNWSDATFFSTPFKFSAKEEDDYKQIKEHIENIIRGEKEGQILRELLEVIFFVTVKNAIGSNKTDHSSVASSYRAEQRITHPKCFRKYFMLKVSSSEVSDNFIETTLQTWDKSDRTEKEKIIKETFFELQKQNNLLEFIKELMVFINRINDQTALGIIRVIYKSAENLSREGTEDLWNSEYDKAESLLMWLINEKINRDKIQNVLEEIITQIIYLPFAVRVVLSCKKERGGSLFNIYETIRIEDLQALLASRLKKYFIEEKRDIFELLTNESDWRFVLYQWATNWGDLGNDNRQTVNSYLKAIVGNDVNKFIKFLQSFIRNDYGSKLIFNLNDFKKAYDSEEFIKIASEFISATHVSAEGLKTIKMFLKAVTSKKVKILYYEPLGLNLSQNISKNDWEIVRNEEGLKKINEYGVVILFLHEGTGKGMEQGLSIGTQNDILNYVAKGGNLIAFHDVLFSRNKILSDNLCGHFKGPLSGKKVDIEIKTKEQHVINQNIENFKVQDEGWAGAIPKVDSGEKLVVLFVNQKDEPVVWLREYDKGEVFVVSLGHSGEIIENENIQRIIDHAIKYFSSKE
jgi:hypothetical protein